MSAPYRSEKPEPIKLVCKDGSGAHRQTLTLDASYLVLEWKAAGGSPSRTEYPLSQLDEGVMSAEGVGQAPAGALERGAFFGALGVAVWWSTFREAIPLLPYVFGAVALFDVRRHFAAKQRVECLYLSKKNGEPLLSIDRASCDPAALARFQESFPELVRGATAGVN